jgi:DNA-binding transcriptional regulator YiaG
MKLNKYLTDSRTTTEQFARKIKVTASTVSKWRAGYRKPNRVHTARVAKATNNAVTHDDWV